MAIMGTWSKPHFPMHDKLSWQAKSQLVLSHKLLTCKKYTVIPNKILITRDDRKNIFKFAKDFI
jgi:hypothetical protein